MIRNGTWGLVLVFLSLLVFLHWRVAFWVMMGLVLAITGSLVCMKLLGQTLNLIRERGVGQRQRRPVAPMDRHPVADPGGLGPGARLGDEGLVDVQAPWTWPAGPTQPAISTTVWPGPQPNSATSWPGPMSAAS